MPPGRKSLYRLIEAALAIAGVLCLTVFLVGLLHRWVSGREALKQFDLRKDQTGQEKSRGAKSWPPALRQVDFSSWSEKRVGEYLVSLGVEFPVPLAVLRIERVGISGAVFSGTDDLTLNRGLGWIAGTALPGQDGNVGIAGHRDGFFRALKDIAAGDQIEMETLHSTFRYKIDSIEIVTPEDVSVLAPRGANSLTLVTCYPFYFIGDAPQRYIVHATQQGSARGASSPQLQSAHTFR